MASIIQGFEYDIFISYRQKDNKGDRWVSEFVDSLKNELGSTFKEDISVYFDINPHDGLLETHDVDASLREKLKCLVFIPIISQTYCDSKSFAWQHEFCAFNKSAKENMYGRDIRLPSGNVASRILPVKIHDLDPEDKALLENELGGVLRPIEFIYKAPGVNRSLKPNDDRTENLNHTNYRDQINKVANAVKEIINGLKGFEGAKKGTSMSTFSEDLTKRTKQTWIKRGVISLLIITSLMVYLVFPKIREKYNKNQGIGQVKSIAVLQFENRNGPEQEYLSTGISDELIHTLVHIGLKVPGRTSSYSFKNKNVDLRTIGKKLDVRMLVEGSCQQQGDSIQVTAQLIDSENGFTIWSEKYEEQTSDIFAVQDKIANSIAEKLKVTVLGNNHHSRLKDRIQNPDARNLYLRGRFFWNKRLPDDLKRGIGFFKQAIVLDSLYAEAYSGIADCYSALGWGSFMAPGEAFLKAKEAAVKAIKLDSTMAEPHASLGYYKMYFERNWKEAEEEFKTSIELDPTYVFAYDWYGYFLTAMGRFKEAHEMIQKAKDLDPLSPVIGADMGFTLFYGGKNDQSIEELISTLELSQQYPNTHLWLSRAYQQKKMYTEALVEYRKTLIAIPDWPVALAGIGNIYGIIQEDNNARRMLDTLGILSSKEYVTPYGVALIYAGLGEKDNAFHWLDKSYEEHSNFLVWLKVDPRWAPIRSDKRYSELIRKVGLLL